MKYEIVNNTEFYRTLFTRLNATTKLCKWMRS